MTTKRERNGVRTRALRVLRQARADGYAVADIAEWAGVALSTCYRWLEGDATAVVARQLEGLSTPPYTQARRVLAVFGEEV
jgi:transposase